MEINKKQAGTLFILAVFVLSGISFAVSWKPPSEKTEENSGIMKQPLADEQRAILIDNDVTVLTLFYLEEDEDSQAIKKDTERLDNEIGEKLLLEEIDVNTYQSFSSEYNVKSVPTVLIRGKENKDKPIRLEGLKNYDELKEKICSTYSEKPELCG